MFNRFALLLVVFTAPFALQAQPALLDTVFSDGLLFRNIGPFRGGRSAAVTGIANQPLTYYFGSVGGGVWKTQDGGNTWFNVSDGYFGGSIGAVAVSEWDPNIVYVGGGEKTVRGNMSHGSGMWKSEDAGRTWRAIGLEKSRHIPRIRIHPRNPDLVYAAVLGSVYGPGGERGVYRSKNGGETWEQVLVVNDNAGAVDLIFDPTNPRTLYASTWRVRRTPYSLESGGEGSALWKSTDGGDTWKELTGQRNGLPSGTLGIIGVAVSPLNPDRVWAIVEAAEGGVYRSDDAGKSWRRINDDRNLRQRAWYYTRLYAGTEDEDVVYVLNVAFWKSKDGGRTYQSISTPHSDHHDLWIDPQNGDRMIVGDDGGAQVTYDGGQNWSTYHNQPTAQFYRVTTDDHVPYRIYGAQQDNSTVRILSRTDGGSIGERDWEPTAGGESGWIAPDPRNNDIVYGGSYGGYLTRLDHRTGQERDINVWPDNPMGHGARDLKYRFQWNFPLLFSRHDPARLYAAGNVLFATTDEGQSWNALSGDLTRADTSMMGPSGGPITKDNTSVEYYGTIFALAEGSRPGTIWTGSDDGFIHLTQDDGATWTNVTPPAMPAYAQVNAIEADPFHPGGLYVAATRYKANDFRPYLYHTTDYGKTWKTITSGIDPEHFTRVIRADPERQGLLFAGTENGLYLSINNGSSWQPFQLNLPIVPVTDLAIKGSDLIVATQGRSFWVLDDLTPLRQYSPQVLEGAYHLFAPRPTLRINSYGGQASRTAGQNADGGVLLRYYLREQPDSSAIKLRILESNGTEVAVFTPETSSALPLEKGLNTFSWNRRYADAEQFPGLVLWGGGLNGPRALPGTYQARLIVGDDSTMVPFQIVPDPRSTATGEDYQAQYDFLVAVRDKLTETHSAIKQIRQVRTQLGEVNSRLGESAEADSVRAMGKRIARDLATIEETLYQTQNQSGQDPLNYPIRLNNRLSALVGSVSTGDFRPTSQAEAVRQEVTTRIDVALQQLQVLLNTDIAAYNAAVRALNVSAVDPGRPK